MTMIDKITLPNPISLLTGLFSVTNLGLVGAKLKACWNDLWRGKGSGRRGWFWLQAYLAGMASTDVEMRDVAVASGEGSSASTSKAKRFEMKKWNAVAFWGWDVTVDNCGVCKNHIMEICIECQSNAGSSTTEECTVAFGTCNHAFHFHCISRWLKTRNTCPLCGAEWDFQKYGN